MKKIFVYLFDGFSDWEISFLAPEINKNAQFDLVYFSESGKPITSMGGLRVMPATAFHDIDFGDVDMLILPGGLGWETRKLAALDELSKNVFANCKHIAAICAATTYLGRLGFLDNLKHTSNDLNYLKALAPEYRGAGNYQNSLAVSHENVITAMGIAPIEFAQEVFKAIELDSAEAIEKWFQLFKNGIWSEA